MKTQIPETANEVLMAPDELLVTRTDLKGKILYANNAFVELSGYSREELIGAKHNIVRHSDMPSQVFEELWTSLKLGKPWIGLIKNRTKSGDFYWVEANVTPVYKNGSLLEYMSVRYAPTRQQVSQAELFYKAVKAKAVKMKPTGKATLVKLFSKIAFWKAVLANIALSGVSGLFCYRLFLSEEYLLLMSVAGITVTALILKALAGWQFRQSLQKSADIIAQLSEGKFRNHIDLHRNDQIGSFLRKLHSMQVQLNFELAEARQLAEETLRIRHALDNVQSSVMVTDSHMNIIYMNRSIQQLFVNAEQNIRKQLPNFDAGKLQGTNISVFHKHPASNQAMLDMMKQTFSSEIRIADQYMRVVINPVVNDYGERIGFVTEWVNRTEEVKIELEIANVVAIAVQGDFGQRIAEQDKRGFYLTLTHCINLLMETSSTGLDVVTRLLGALANGDLTQERLSTECFGTYKRLQNNANAGLETLRALILEIKDATENIHTAAKEITAGNNDLSQRTEEQAVSLEQTAVIMEELTSTVKQNTENTKKANQVVMGATKVADKGVAVVNEVVSTMALINDSSNKIAEIISVIDGIAFQTNILALNAAVEAARAGDQGRGFAVVAAEVRNLSQRAAAAAGEIKILINNSEEKVAAGSKLVMDAGLTMQEVVLAINNVSLIMSGIATASDEQSIGIAQVNQSISQMDYVTQQNAALVEQSAASAESLEEQCQSLSRMVNKFKLDQQASATTQTKDMIAELVNSHRDLIAEAQNTVLASGDWEEF